ncbi:uncharacterized protein LOC141724326 isoform X3 [Apium graveolens]|uniref:uncharacterized protein LOC141724326 isoform X3 n=1 Tax=Apium graveolens TaxID=4045 RepID=UPI003D78FBB9
MVLSTTTPTAASRFPVMALPSSFKFPKGFNLRSFETDQNVKYFHEKEATQRSLRKMVSCSVSKDSGASVDKYDVPFPSDYDQLLQQAREASELALKDKIQLMEIEFPTAGLDSVPGDGEGGIEMTGSMQLIREFCDLFIKSEKVTRTRIFFPEANEVIFARGSVFEGASFKLDYLTKPSFFEDFGFTEKVKMTDRVKAEDELFVVALSGILLSKACSTHKDAVSEDGNCILYPQFQRPQWWNPFQVLPWSLEGAQKSW